MNEVWKDHPHYNGIIVSNYGKVMMAKSKRIRKFRINHAGYAKYQLRVDGKYIMKFAHRLVAETFLDLPLNTDLEVNHINAVKTDNRVSNLECVSRKRNMEHATSLGIIKSSRAKGSSHYKYKYSREFLEKIFSQKEQGDSLEEIANSNGLTVSAVENVVHRKTYKEKRYNQ